MAKKTRHSFSPHFRVEEFDCRDGTRVPTYAWAKLNAWCDIWGEPLREQFGAVTILSGFRTERHNNAVGGAGGSFHVYSAKVGPQDIRRGQLAVAVDVKCASGGPMQWHAWAARRRSTSQTLTRARAGGIGLYIGQGFVHLDTGPRRDWTG